MSKDDETKSANKLKPGQQVLKPSAEKPRSKSLVARKATRSKKTGRKGRKTITENHKKALVERHQIEIEEKKQKLEQKKANDVHVKQTMEVLKANELRRAVNPKDIAKVRTNLYNIVVAETERARLFLAGKLEWNSNQVRLYGMLLNKVMPDLSQKFTEVNVNHRTAKDLSREELEAIVAEAEAIEENDNDSP